LFREFNLQQSVQEIKISQNKNYEFQREVVKLKDEVISIGEHKDR
jgi:predicted sulfurtransferase